MMIHGDHNLHVCGFHLIFSLTATKNDRDVLFYWIVKYLAVVRFPEAWLCFAFTFSELQTVLIFL